MLSTDKIREGEHIMNIHTLNQNAYMYSIHTLELGIRLKSYTYGKLIKILTDYSRKYHFCYYSPENCPSILVFDMFKDFGFTYCYARYLCAKDHPYSSHCFYMIINPRRLLHIPDYQYICITPPERIKDIIPYIMTLFENLGVDFINYDKTLFVKRLDFCTNIKLDNAEMTREYMRLLCKGKYIFRASRRLQYSPVGHRKIYSKQDFTITGANFELSIYNKKEQMELSSFSYPYEEQKISDNQIRIELRIFYPRLYHLKQTYGTAEGLFNYIPELSQRYMDRYLQAAYGKGDFHQYNIAVNIIKDSSFHDSTKSHMIRFMKKISKTSLQEAINFFKEETDFPDITFILNKFNELQISPITISQKSNYAILRHPIHYIQTQNVNLSPYLE